MCPGWLPKPTATGVAHKTLAVRCECQVCSQFLVDCPSSPLIICGQCEDWKVSSPPYAQKDYKIYCLHYGYGGRNHHQCQAYVEHSGVLIMVSRPFLEPLMTAQVHENWYEISSWQSHALEALINFFFFFLNRDSAVTDITSSAARYWITILSSFCEQKLTSTPYTFLDV